MFTIQEFNTQFSKSIIQSFANQSWEAVKNSAFAKLADVSDTDEYTESFTSTEGFEMPGYFDEDENLKISNLGKGYKVTYESREFGHRIKITKKARNKLNDSSEKIALYANRQKNSAIVTMYSFIEKEFHKLFNDAFAGALIIAPDLQPIISASHAWKNGTIFSNLLAPAVLTQAVVDNVEALGGAFVDSEGVEMPLNFKTIVVKKGGKAAVAAKQLFGLENIQAQYRPTAIGNINIYAGEYTIIETPYITSGNAYFFVADNEMLGMENPFFVNFIERPSLQGEFTSMANLTWEAAWAGSFKFGVRNLPFTIVGSVGA